MEMSGQKNFFSISNLYLAYRKAKAEAFYESTHFHALAFTKYEQDLNKNLRRLRKRLIEAKPNWPTDSDFIGDYAYIPKSVDIKVWEKGGDSHFRALDPRSDWRRRYEEANVLADASLRLIIRPTVDFQVLSALWIIHVGHLFDSTLNPDASYGNRLRRSQYEPKDERVAGAGLNVGCPGLFSPYFTAYREWRENGLKAMNAGLKHPGGILAITMDIERFYHRVSPKFLLRPSFLDSINLKLTAEEIQFTKYFLAAIEGWYRRTPDFAVRNEGALPVGLSASKIIANVLLVHFDQMVLEKLRPDYYGRYVDDIFLVLKAENGDLSASNVAGRLRESLPLLKPKVNESGPDSLELKLPYADDSELIFSGKKQKIFSLSSDHGADLVDHIQEQIRSQSSEYRLLPTVPDTGAAMAARALLATPDATLQVDALRKADVVSVRRLGFSLLLSDVEIYAADLRPDSWQSVRKEFYGLVKRHVVTPSGFFDYFSYIPRVYGLMLACGDARDARNFVDELVEVVDLLRESTTLGLIENKDAFNLCLEQYGAALHEAGLKAATARSLQIDNGYLGAIRRLKKLMPSVKVPRTVLGFQELVKQILLADWGRRPYKDYWFHDQANDEMGPFVPKDLSVQRQIRLGAIRRFRKSVAKDLKVPHWPALAFPTRPLRIDEMGLVAPRVFEDHKLLRTIIDVLRGARVASVDSFGYGKSQGDDEFVIFYAPGHPRDKIRIAVTSIGTSLAQWESAAKQKHDRSLERYRNFNNLINRALREEKRLDYIVMPELSIPLRWATRAAQKLAKNGVSLLAGVEYHRDRTSKKLRNDCLISLTTSWPGYRSGVIILQSKFLPAHDERRSLRGLLKKDGGFHIPSGYQAKPTVYHHRGFALASLICSDMTNINHRNALRGEVDALFVLEWNQDINTFSSLVESAANDLHAFVIQVNNRIYGDSRIRAPARVDYERDVVQVKGGISDYFVVGEIDYRQLRKEQQGQIKGHKNKAVRRFPRFKPMPIGYASSPKRKTK